MKIKRLFIYPILLGINQLLSGCGDVNILDVGFTEDSFVVNSPLLQRTEFPPLNENNEKQGAIVIGNIGDPFLSQRIITRPESNTSPFSKGLSFQFGSTNSSLRGNTSLFFKPAGYFDQGKEEFEIRYALEISKIESSISENPRGVKIIFQQNPNLPTLGGVFLKNNKVYAFQPANQNSFWDNTISSWQNSGFLNEIHDMSSAQMDPMTITFSFFLKKVPNGNGPNYIITRTICSLATSSLPAPVERIQDIPRTQTPRMTGTQDSHGFYITMEIADENRPGIRDNISDKWYLPYVNASYK